MLEYGISVIVPTHNQGFMIGDVLRSIINNCSELVRELIVILDGCVDNSREEVIKATMEFNGYFQMYSLNNVNEVLASNDGARRARSKYIMFVQDDMIIQEKDFDKRLLKPFEIIPNLLAVSGRDSADARITNDTIDYYNLEGKDKNSPKNIFYVRDVINRGPLLLDHEKFKELEYFDEEFAPIDSDDADLSFRAYQKGYLVGSYWIDYKSDLLWGKTRNNYESNKIWEKSMIKNHKLLIKRHKDFLNGEKHSFQLIIE
jgi:glycosyltransferase involved in cell wall biosynthesis